jgi:hypothetical protein
VAQVPLELRVSLREGSIFYFEERKLTSAQSHFHIVANADPLAQQVLILTVVTSKVDKVKYFRRDRPDTLVELSPRDLPKILTKPSIVDCKSGDTCVARRILCDRWRRKEIAAFAQDVPVALRRAIRRAIHASDILTDEVKVLVAPPEASLPRQIR